MKIASALAFIRIFTDSSEKSPFGSSPSLTLAGISLPLKSVNPNAIVFVEFSNNSSTIFLMKLTSINSIPTSSGFVFSSGSTVSFS